jgi:hypothetical protein
MSQAANFCWLTLGDDLADKFQEQHQLLLELASEKPFPTIQSQIVITIPSQVYDDDLPF